MAKRMIIMLAAVGLLIAGLGFFKFRQFQSYAQAGGFKPPPEAVTTLVVHQESWPSTLNAVGTVVAVRGVTISADLPGIVQKIDFESGKAVHQGDVLIELDTREERAQLASAEATRDLAKQNLTRWQGLVDQGVVSRVDYDNQVAQARTAEAKVGEIKATIERKTLRAPFSGVLGIIYVNLGQYLAAGAPIVSLEALDPVYVDFGIPQQASVQLHVGQTVRIKATDLGGAEYTGKVSATDMLVDPTTRNVQVRATFANPGTKLHPGMFVETSLAMGAGSNVITLPASAISFAPYGDSVYVVSDLKDQSGHTYRGVTQRFIKTGPQRGDQVAVLSGLNQGDEVVTSGTFKLRNNAAVEVNNKVQPSNSAAPKVEER